MNMTSKQVPLRKPQVFLRDDQALPGRRGCRLRRGGCRQGPGIRRRLGRFLGKPGGEKVEAPENAADIYIYIYVNNG